MHWHGSAVIHLHDATLERIELLWEKKLCRCFVTPVYQTEPRKVCLEFSQVSQVHIEHVEPWGPSNSILETTNEEHSYVFKMQSGDNITVVAAGFTEVAL